MIVEVPKRAVLVHRGTVSDNLLPTLAFSGTPAIPLDWPLPRVALVPVLREGRHPEAHDEYGQSVLLHSRRYDVLLGFKRREPAQQCEQQRHNG